MEKGFLIQDGRAVSINDLVARLREGCFVARTGHLGNHYFSNLLLFACGIPCAIFDRNLLLKDQNFWPSKIICGGKKSALAQENDVLVPFSVFAENLNGSAQFAAGKNNPGQVHYESMQSAFGATAVYTESQFLHQRAARASEVAAVMQKIDPDLFVRTVHSDGKVEVVSEQKDAIQGFLRANEAMSLLVDGRPADFAGGVVPKVEATIMLHAILGQQDSTSNVVYELSGPDMIRYALRANFQKKMQDVYQKMRQELRWLPETLILVIVPSFSFRFGSLKSEKNELDHLLQNLKKFSTVSAEKKMAMRESELAVARIRVSRGEQNEQKRKIGAVFNGKLRETAGEIFSSAVGRRIDFNLKDGNFFSQYDLLAAGQELYVPEEVQSLTMAELEQWQGWLDSARNYAS